MSTWVIQRVEALSMHDGRDLADRNEPMFVDQFSNENDFADSLRDGGIAGVAQDNHKQDNNNEYFCSNTDEDIYKPRGIYLDLAAACGKISGFTPPEQPVELSGVDPP